MELEQGDTVLFDVMNTGSTTDFTLLDPDGRSKVFSGYSDSGPHEIKKTGTYSLAADPRADKLGDFEANLYRLEPAVIDNGTLSLNEYVAAETAQPGQSIAYTVNLEAGTTLFFDVQSTTNTTDVKDTAIDVAGTYTLTADPRGDDVSTFDIARLECG